MTAKAKNPLLSPQREKVGSETAADYAYQYHWALYRAIQEQGSQKEYAVFVELHEDVVVCDSLDADKAKFEFNQVKTTKKKFTTHVLIDTAKSSSVLGKLLSSSAAKPYADKIKEINFIAVSGFSIRLKQSGLNLNKVTLPDIDDTELATIALAIKNELSLDPLPSSLQFIIPDLPDKTFQQFVIGEISKLITNLYPGSHYNSYDIYRILIDELNRKGEVSFDFTRWDELLKNKALTSLTVTSIIGQYTSLKDEAKVQSEYSEIVRELNLSVMAGKSLKKSFDRYRQMRIGNRTVSQLNTSTKLRSLISANTASANNDINALINLVFNSVDEKTRRNFASVEALRAAIICEYIMEDS